MLITVLGKSPSWPDVGGACSGYLIQEDGFNLLLDCGSGVFGKLRRVIDYLRIDAVLISHLHSDHFFDLVPFSYALLYSPRRPVQTSPPPLYAPPAARDALRGMVGAWGSEELVETAFSLHEYEPKTELAVGPLRARFAEVPHFTRAFAVDLRGPISRLTFGADCGPNDALVTLARDTDLLLIEATLTEPESDGARGHLTAHEAGEHGRRAGARRVLITHFSDELDAEQMAASAAAGFGAPVDLAREGATYAV